MAGNYLCLPSIHNPFRDSPFHPTPCRCVWSQQKRPRHLRISYNDSVPPPPPLPAARPSPPPGMGPAHCGACCLRVDAAMRFATVAKDWSRWVGAGGVLGKVNTVCGPCSRCPNLRVPRPVLRPSSLRVQPQTETRTQNPKGPYLVSGMRWRRERYEAYLGAPLFFLQRQRKKRGEERNGEERRKEIKGRLPIFLSTTLGSNFRFFGT